MKVGQFYIATCTSSSPNFPLDTSLLVASTDNPAVVVEKQGDGTVKVTAAVPGTANITYSAPGFKPAGETVTVEDTPAIVVSDGPVQG